MAMAMIPFRPGFAPYDPAVGHPGMSRKRGKDNPKPASVKITKDGGCVTLKARKGKKHKYISIDLFVYVQLSYKSNRLWIFFQNG
jgi:hypothetical protein